LGEDCTPALLIPKPPCAKPDTPCPPGSDWWLDPKDNTWKCTVGGQPPNTVPADSPQDVACKPKAWGVCDADNVDKWKHNLLGVTADKITASDVFGITCDQKFAPPTWWKLDSLPFGKTIWKVFAGVVCSWGELIQRVTCSFIGTGACSLPEFTAVAVLRSLTG